MTEPDDFVFARVQSERRQRHETRQHLFEKIESMINTPLVTFFTSMEYPVQIDNDDADMLEALLQKVNTKFGLTLMISSRGGQGLAAERIVNVLRAYAQPHGYHVIVPNKAKSAATMICFGANRIFMSPTSELGPVDPQLVTRDETGRAKLYSVFNIIKSYDRLFSGAVKTTGNLEPYLQQLQRYDAKEIADLRDAMDLAKDISIRTLRTGMLSGKTDKQIEKQIKVFLTPETTKAHGRPIYADEAGGCGLNVTCIDVGTDLWEAVYELYLRTDMYTRGEVAKCVESREHAFGMTLQGSD